MTPPTRPDTQRKTLELFPGCKINLYLRIHCRRSDGYHELETVFFPLSQPTDRIYVHMRPDTYSGLQFTCSNHELENNSNLIVKAYNSFAATTGFAPALSVYLEKRTPTGAGLGGGSADAAAMLSCLNTLAANKERSVSPGELRAMGSALGADVPFFLQDGPAIATGIGEKLVPAPHVAAFLSGMHLLLCCPSLQISTSWAYAEWDTQQSEKSSLTGVESEGIDSFCLKAMVLFNSFEELVFRSYPELREIKELLLRHGAQGALLSGSGSSVFGLYRDKQQALTAKTILKASGIATVMQSC